MEENLNSNKSSSSQGNNKMVPYMIGGVLVVIAIFGFVLLSKGGSTTNPTPTIGNQVMGDETAANDTMDAMSESESLTSSDVMSADVRTINVEAGSFYYKPTTITVKKGEKVQIVMVSKDMMHDFNIDELNVHLPITKSGETKTVEFTATKVGTFEYYCSVGQHRKMGQIGKITVTE